LGCCEVLWQDTNVLEDLTASVFRSACKAEKMYTFQIEILGVVTSCSAAIEYQRFRRLCCLYLHIS